MKLQNKWNLKYVNETVLVGTKAGIRTKCKYTEMKCKRKMLLNVAKIHYRSARKQDTITAIIVGRELSGESVRRGHCPCSAVITTVGQDKSSSWFVYCWRHHKHCPPTDTYARWCAVILTSDNNILFIVMALTNRNESSLSRRTAHSMYNVLYSASGRWRYVDQCVGVPE